MIALTRQIKDRKWTLVRKYSTATLYEKLRARYNLGYWPCFKNPRTFNEKIIHAKLFGNIRSADKLADKYAVREYVEEKVGAHILNKLYFIGECPDDIPFDTLPEKFVIKTTHGSGGIFIVKDKEQADYEKLRQNITNSLGQRFGYITNELWYLKIKPKIIIEELLEDNEHGIPFDYKFFCFHGKCHFVQVDLDRFSNHTRSFYSPDWILQDFALLFPQGRSVSKPENLADMIKIAEKLAADFDFVRIDLYSVNNEVRFGEITFAPGAGWEPFNPANKDLELGKLW